MTRTGTFGCGRRQSSNGPRLVAVALAIRSDADHLGVHLQPITHLLRIDIPIRRPGRSAVLQQRRHRMIRIQGIASLPPPER